MMERYHGLDLLRSLAMVLGLVIHAPLVYDIGKNTLANLPNNSEYILMISNWIHFWRMPVFFILAGFFCQMVLTKKNLHYFLSDRFIRIFLALIIFCLIQNILFSSYIFALSHFWFLYYLFIISVIYTFLFKLRNIKYFKIISNIYQFPLKKVLILPIYLFPIILLKYFSHELEAKYIGYSIIPKNILEFKIGSFVYYFMWFTIGCALFNQSHLLDELKKIYLLFIFFVIALISMFIYWEFTFGAIYENKNSNFISTPLIFMITISSGITTFCWVFCLIGLTHRIINKKLKILDFFIEISYPVYLLHMIFLMTIGMAIVWKEPSETFPVGPSYNGLNLDLAILINIVVSFILCIISYYIFIKYTPLNWVVNGYKKSWFKFKTLRKY